MSVCVSCVYVSHLCLSPAHRSSLQKGIILWLFGAKLLGLIGGLSKNAVHHNDQFDKMEILISQIILEIFFLIHQNLHNILLIFKM